MCLGLEGEGNDVRWVVGCCPPQRIHVLLHAQCMLSQSRDIHMDAYDMLYIVF